MVEWEGKREARKQARVRVRVRGLCQRYGLVWDRMVLRSSGERRFPAGPSTPHPEIPLLLAPGRLVHDLWGAKGGREQIWS